MKKTFLILVVFLLASDLKAQNWIPANIPLTVNQVRSIFADTINDKLYIAGAITVDGSGNYFKNAICVYNGSDWEILDTINDLILSMTVYNNELIVGGTFPGTNGQSMPYLVKWDGTSWQHLGGNIDASVRRVKVINNELYVTGLFSQIGGIQANHIAKWDGNSWSDLFSFPFMPGGYLVEDIAFFNGEWYVGGNFTLPNGVSDLSVYRNNLWQKVGSSDTLQGAFTTVNDLTIYNGELIVSGLIMQSQGNVGHGLQKWNGVSWSEVGESVQDWNNLTSGSTQVFDVISYSGKLYVGGNFSYAGHIPAQRFAIWDGVNWCSTSDNFGSLGNIQAMGVFHDTLWIGGVDSINGVYMNRVAKWNSGTVDTCSILNVYEIVHNSINLDIYPNPFTENITIDINPFSIDDSSKLAMFNVNGRIIWEYKIVASDNKLTVPSNSMPRGIYFIQYTDSKITLTRKLIKL